MAKKALGQPLTDEDYAKFETKETKLREVTNMQNYVNNIAESYGRNSEAVMEEMLKLNGCDSVAELQAKVARGESIVEASDTAWNARIQKQHYAAYDKMLEAQRKVAIQGAISYQNGLQMFRDGEKYRDWERQNSNSFLSLGDKSYGVRGMSVGGMLSCGIGSLGGEVQLTFFDEERDVMLFGNKIGTIPTDFGMDAYFVNKSGMGIPDNKDHSDSEKFGITNGARDNNLRIGNPQLALGFDFGVNFFTGSGNFNSFAEAKDGWKGYTNEAYVGILPVPISLGIFESATLRTSNIGWQGVSVGFGPTMMIGGGQSYTYNIREEIMKKLGKGH